MQIIKTKSALRQEVKKARQEGHEIGLVPTMGYLHEGHLSLMTTAKRENSLVVASVFVNPTQFGPDEDFATYPRDLERDAQKAASVGVDILFAPDVDEMYGPGTEAYVDVTELSRYLCGAKRPGHFRGVCTVVTKLFNIVQPDRAYFGQKDAQQAIIIQKMVADLDQPVDVKILPIIREVDGLAMSSRNKNLNPAERQAALVLRRSLQRVEELLQAGEQNAHILKETIGGMIEREPLARVDYVAVVSATTLEEVEVVTGPTLIALAVFIGKTRLIDNLIWEG